MNEWLRQKRIADMYKEKYPKGTRVKLISMGNDPRPIKSGAIGIVKLVDDMGTIHVKWDNGRTLGLIPQVDEFEKI